MKKKILESYLSPLVATLTNLLLAYVVYAIARVAYLLDNWSYFADSLTMEVVQGGLVFDTAAILVTNIPYIVLMLLPLHWKETRFWHRLCQVVFVVVNGLAPPSSASFRTSRTSVVYCSLRPCAIGILSSSSPWSSTVCGGYTSCLVLRPAACRGGVTT